MLLSRVADHLFWGARYLERADATARIVRTFTDVIVDLPTKLTSSWEPLLAVAGSKQLFAAGHARANEADIVRFLVADTQNQGSVVASVAAARDNLRSTREVLPREAWQTVNDLYLYTGSNGEAGVDRRSRSRFLSRVLADCQRFDGVITSAMSRDESYEMWRLGQSIERADMTTRVLGVRAAALLATPEAQDDYDEVQWMGVLRSLTAMQMYQRSTRGPISAPAVIKFLLSEEQFPRSIAGAVRRIRRSLEALPHSDRTLAAVEDLESVLGELAINVSDVVGRGSGGAVVVDPARNGAATNGRAPSSRRQSQGQGQGQSQSQGQSQGQNGAPAAEPGQGTTTVAATDGGSSAGGAVLDAAMDQVQALLAALSSQVTAVFIHGTT